MADEKRQSRNRTYKLIVPSSHLGHETIVSSGNITIEIADVVGKSLVRNQLHVSVEHLVGALLPEDKLNKLREMDNLVLRGCGVGHQGDSVRRSAAQGVRNMGR